jgi:hypothetical protein
VRKLAGHLDIDPTAVYQWIRGCTSPRPETAIVILMLLKDERQLKLKDVYEHRAIVRDQI